MALGTDFIVRYLSDITLAVKGARDLQSINEDAARNIAAKYGEVTRIIGSLPSQLKTIPIKINGQDAIKTIQILGTATETSQGKFVNFYETTTRINGQLVGTSGSIKDVTNQFTKTAVESEKANKSFHTLAENTLRLALRAALTIPIWQALRGVMESTTRVFTDGFNELIKDSLALDKIKNTLSGTSSEISSSLEKIKTSTESLSIISGVSHEKILAAYQKFSSVGLDVATSLAATNAVIKLSVVTQSDATITAEGLAHALSVLVDSNATAIDKQKQMNDIVALTSDLWKTNGFNIEEFVGSLEKFSITAKSVNFTTNETLALLATLSKSGLGSAGNLLRNSIGQLLVNLDKLAMDLGVTVNPAIDDTFSVLMKVLGVLNDLQKTKDLKGLEQAKEALKDIFGGTRSAVPITALSSLYDILQKNISLIPDINNLNTSFQNSEKILGNVVTRIHNTNTEIGKAFVAGLFATKDFNDALEQISLTLIDIQKNAQEFGKIIRGTFGNPLGSTLEQFAKLDEVTANISQNINQQLTKALHFELPLDQINKLIPAVEDAMKGKIDLGLGPKALGTIMESLLYQSVGMEAANKRFAELLPQITTETSKQNSLEEKNNKLILQRKDFLKLEGILRKELSATGLSEADVEEKILTFRTESKKFSENDLKLQTELVIQARLLEEITLRQSRARGLIENQLSLLEAQGATTVQVIKERIELEKMYGINLSRADQLKNELELNKAITKEKSNQNKISSDSMKLAEIGQKYGVQTATRVAEFISGKTPLRAIEPGGQSSDLLPILKEFFSAELEQKKAQEFLFQGLGKAIPIPEREAIKEFKPLPLESIKLPDINTNIQAINVEVKKLFSEKDTAKQIMDAMLEAINGNSAIISAIKEQIEEY